MKKYVLFGAGIFAEQAIKLLAKENIEFIMDNNPGKDGSNIEGIPVVLYQKVKSICKSYVVVISANDIYYNEIKSQLNKDGVVNYITLQDMRVKIIKNKIENRFECIEVYKRAIQWIKNNTVDGSSIICNSEKLKPYPEVTGYYIPTLIRWGYRELAKNYAKWLIKIQKKDGSWFDTDDNAPYIFDTAQILKGLIEIRKTFGKEECLDNAIINGVEWILGCMLENGNLITPDKTCWGNDKNTCSELIHIYCLSPIVEASAIYDREEYKSKAYKILDYYKNEYYEKIVNFSLLSHFYAYVMEGLVDLGEIKLARKAMDKIALIQKKTGAVPAYNNVDWICSTGLFQFALVWYKLGDIEHGNKAFDYACKLQNDTGGWYGSYLSEENTKENNTYFPTSEISWANKYFLDALYYKNKAEFNALSDEFLDLISVDDERYCTVLDIIKNSKDNAYILDVGCGKGRYLKNLLKDAKNKKYFGVDISRKVMSGLDTINIVCREGSMTNIPFDDNFFSVVYSCEALEHAIDIESAISEMVRVTEKGGYIVIIDKNDSSYGQLEIGMWEQWLNEAELKQIMQKYCDKVFVKHGIEYEGEGNSDLFSAWIGIVG